MLDPLLSPSLDGLLEFIRAEVSRHFEETRRPVDGASLAEVIRNRFSSLSYATLAPDRGIQRLGDVIREAEKRGLLVRRRDVRHLEVLPADTYAGSTSIPAQLSPPKHAGPIRREIWQALLFFHTEEARFFDRQTGNVVSVPAAQARAYVAVPRYVSLETIPAEVQKRWMHDFVSSNPGAAGAASAIELERWYTEFPRALRELQPELAVAWGSTRARYVIAYVKQWAAEHGIPLEEVLTSRTRPANRPEAGGGTAPSPLPAQQSKSNEGETFRTAVLAALSDMSLEELLSLSLPLRHLARHFKPR
jgi:hypothetical protein